MEGDHGEIKAIQTTGQNYTRDKNMEQELGQHQPNGTGQQTMENPSLHTKDTVAEIFKDIQNMLVRLEKLNEEAVVLWTCSNTVLGTSVLTAFLKQESGLLQRFQQFCQDHKKKYKQSDNNSALDTAKEVIGNEKSDPEKENGVVHAGYSDDDTIPDYSDDYDDDDDDYTPETDAQNKSNKRNLSHRNQNENDNMKRTRLRTGVISRHSLTRSLLTGRKAINKTDVKTHNDKVKIIEASSKGSQVMLKTGKGLRQKRLLGSTDVTVEGELPEMTVVTPREASINTASRQPHVLSCFKCSKKFNSIGKLREHMTKAHNIKSELRCECGKIFKNEKALKFHKAQTPHSPCEQCNEVFESKELMMSHVQEKHEANEDEKTELFTCAKCGSSFEYETFLEMHTRKLPNCDTVLSKEYDINEALTETITFTEKSDNTESSPTVKVTKTVKEIISKQSKIPFKCVVCDSSYNRKSNYTRHMMTHVSVASFTCNICGLNCKSRESMTRHRKEHLFKPYNCSYCRARFGDEEELKSHSEKVCRGGNNANLTCDVCFYVAASRSALEKHMMKHTGERPFSCKYCGKGMATKSSLERHVLAMHEEHRPHKCNHCPKSFKTKDTYRKHLKTHSEPRYSCELCGKTCVELGNLKKHMMTHTKEKPFVCEICGKAYGRKSLMENHRRLHTGEKPYTCQVENCGKAFRSYSNLKQHIRSHASTKEFVCDICGRSFKQPGRLNHHRKDHLIDYRWPCGYCPNKYKSLFMYKNHLAKSHADKKKEIEETSNIRLYQCHLCSKMYGDKEDLTRHIYIHTGTKPFKCPYCPKAFNDKSNLKQHEKIHTGDRKHVCHVCKKAFIHNKTLRLHAKTCHGITGNNFNNTDQIVNSAPQNIGHVVGVIQMASVEQLKERLGNGERNIIAEESHVQENQSAENNELEIDEIEADESDTGMIDETHQRVVSVENVPGLLEPLMIIENF